MAALHGDTPGIGRRKTERIPSGLSERREHLARLRLPVSPGDLQGPAQRTAQGCGHAHRGAPPRICPLAGRMHRGRAHAREPGALETDHRRTGETPRRVQPVGIPQLLRIRIPRIPAVLRGHRGRRHVCLQCGHVLPVPQRGLRPGRSIGRIDPGGAGCHRVCTGRCPDYAVGSRAGEKRASRTFPAEVCRSRQRERIRTLCRQLQPVPQGDQGALPAADGDLRTDVQQGHRPSGSGG